jgi:hypothetical protein
MNGRFGISPKAVARLCLLLGLLAAPLLNPVPAAGDGPLAPSMNGDKFDDLAIGHPYEDLYHGGSTRLNAGAASVRYGAEGGFAIEGAMVWSQVWTPLNPPAFDNHFGRALAIGDFDGDDFDDLAVGIPGQDVNGKNRAGAVQVFFGRSTGLSTAGEELWHLDKEGVGAVAHADDRFGQALAAADFNGDSYADLAVGIPYYDIYAARDLGAVHVFYGSGDGLSTDGDQLWYQGSLRGLEDEPEKGDEFGYALGVGDFDCDGYADLAIGAPREALENGVVILEAGVVHVLYGSGSGLSAERDQLWSQDSLGLSQDGSQDGDRFGFALTGGDFNGDACTDLAVGAPGEAIRGGDAGAVNVIYSDGSGLAQASAQYWAQDMLLLSASEPSEGGDQFGYALAGGDFNADGRVDLAVGVPFEGVGAVEEAGAVNIIYGSSGGLGTAIADHFFSQAIGQIEGSGEAKDHFGWALAAADFDANGAADLAIGVPGEDHDPFPAVDAGVVHVLYGRPGHRMTPAGSDTWDEANFQTGYPQDGDQFGYALAASPPPMPEPPPPGDNKVYVPLVLVHYP